MAQTPDPGGGGSSGARRRVLHPPGGLRLPKGVLSHHKPQQLPGADAERRQTPAQREERGTTGEAAHRSRKFNFHVNLRG